MQAGCVGRQQKESPAQGSHEQIAGLCFQQCGDCILAPGNRSPIHDGSLVDYFFHPSAARKPQASIPAPTGSLDIAGVRLCPGRLPRRQPAFFQRPKQTASYHPQFPVLVFGERRHVFHRAKDWGNQFCTLQREKRSLPVEQPEDPVGIGSHVENRPPRPVVSRIDRAEFAGSQLREAAGFMANPKRPVRVFKQTCNPVVPQYRRVAGVKNFEPHAIKSHQPVVCAEPQVTVPGLHYGGDRVLRQPLLRLPHGDRVI